MEGESGVTRSITDDRLSSDIQRDQMKVKVVLLELSLMTSSSDIQGDQMEGESCFI